MTACMPSCPVIPTPTSAIWIMLTSLAPSPMASVITLRLSFTSWTTADWNKCNHKDWQLNENHNKGERSLGATKLLSSRAKINALFQLSVGHYRLFCNERAFVKFGLNEKVFLVYFGFTFAAKENGRGRGRDANKSNVWTPTFCIGAARQHNTTWHLLARSKNLVLRDSSNAYINVRPSMTRPKHWSVGWPMLPDTVQEELLLTLLASEWMWANQDEIWPRHSSCGRKALFWLSCTTSRYYKALWENFPGYKFQVPDRKWYLKLVWKLFKTRTNKQRHWTPFYLKKKEHTLDLAFKTIFWMLSSRSLHVYATFSAVSWRRKRIFICLDQCPHFLIILKTISSSERFTKDPQLFYPLGISYRRGEGNGTGTTWCISYCYLPLGHTFSMYPDLGAYQKHFSWFSPPHCKRIPAHWIFCLPTCLSPVRTQTLRPPWRSLAMVSGTPSCRRSSMPVTPRSSIFFSSRWADSRRSLSRWCRSVSACLWSSSHSLYSPSDNSYIVDQQSID